MHLSRFIPALPAQSHPTPVVGGKAVGATVRDIATRAERILDVSGFRMSLPSALTAFADAHARGVEVNILADTQNLDAAKQPIAMRDAIRGASDVFREYGADPFKQHSKSVGRDRTEAFIASDVSDIESEGRMEFGVRFDGAAAAVYDDLHRIDRDTPTSVAAPVFAAARAAGILVNDPQHGIMDVSDGVKTLIDNAKRTLLLVTKDLESKDLVTRIVSAAERGVRATVITNKMEPKFIDRLTSAGVELKLLPWGVQKRPINIHGTAISTNGLAIVTSLPLVPRAINGSEHRQSRELGVAIDGDAARTLSDRLRRVYRDVPFARSRTKD